MTLLLQIFVYWAYQGVFYLLLGNIFLLWMRKFLSQDPKRRGRQNLFEAIFVGVAGTSAVLHPLSILVAITPNLHTSIASAVISLSLIIPQLRVEAINQAKSVYAYFLGSGAFLGILKLTGLATVVLAVASHAIQEIGPFDTSLYHAQSVELIKSYPAIPGIGNLHDRLAFNNSWFLNIAFFSIGPLADRPFLFQNSFLLLTLILYLTLGLVDRSTRKFFSHTVIFLVFALLAVFFLARHPLFVSSISPDTAAYVLSFYVVTELLFRRFAFRDDLWITALFLIFVVSVTIKFSLFSICILFIPAILAFAATRSARNRVALVFAGLGLLVVVPYCLRNIILSGYLVYPLYFLDFFHLDWKLPLQVAIDQLNAVKGWARRPSPDYTASLGQSLSAWFPYWLTVYGSTPAIVYFKSCIITLPLATFFMAKKMIPQYLQLSLCALILINGIWFFSAPDPRFAYATLLAQWCLLAGICLSPFHLAHWRASAKLIPIGIIFIFAAVIARNRIALRDIVIQGDLPHLHYPTPPKLKMHTNVRGEAIYSPENEGRCWNWSLKCTPYPNPHVVLRGAEISSGFRTLPAQAQSRNPLHR